MERKSLILFLACIFSLNVSSENVTIDGLKYYLFADTHEAAINNGTGGVTIKNGFECENGAELIIK